MNQLNDYNCHIHIAPVHLGACVSARGGGGAAGPPETWPSSKLDLACFDTLF